MHFFISRQLAKRTYLHDILSILGSNLGKSGGYYLLKKPEDVTLADVVRHFEGTISLMYCVSESSYRPCEFCKDEATCQIRKVFKEIRDTTFGILSKTTLRELIKTKDKSIKTKVKGKIVEGEI